jgi:hypothetical protein
LLVFLTELKIMLKDIMFLCIKNRLLAEVWEEVCRLALPALGETGEILSGYGGWSPADRYWDNSGPEWDLVARSQDKSVFLLGEIKWHEGPVSEKDLDKIHSELLAKGLPRLAGSGAFKEKEFNYEKLSKGALV